MSMSVRRSRIEYNLGRLEGIVEVFQWTAAFDRTKVADLLHKTIEELRTDISYMEEKSSTLIEASLVPVDDQTAIKRKVGRPPKKI